jgi:hypothetical protein
MLSELRLGPKAFAVFKLNLLFLPELVMPVFVAFVVGKAPVGAPIFSIVQSEFGSVPLIELSD